MNKLFKSTEELVSMFLGLVIVLVIVGIIFNYFQKRRGSVSLTGVTDQKTLETNQPPEVSKVAENEYIVRKGDNLWRIAVNKLGNGEKWVDIAKENNLKNPGLLIAGQKLTITNAKAEVKTIEGDTYVVKRGDSLWKIAVAAFGDGFKWGEVWKLNTIKIADPNRLEIGMVLKLR